MPRKNQRNANRWRWLQRPSQRKLREADVPHFSPRAEADPTAGGEEE
jgi:hypothetical protein